MSTCRPLKLAADIVQPILVVAWFVVPPWLVLQAIGAGPFYASDVWAAEKRAIAEAWARDAAVAALAIPFVGLIAAAVARRRAGFVVFTVMLLVGLTFAGWVAWSLHVAHRNDPPPPRPRVTVCQDRSGGNATCPGG